MTFDGTFAQYARIPAQAIHPLPDNVSFEAGALIEPLSVATHTLDRIKFYLGDTVVIIGPGVFGLLLTMAFRSYGASKIIVLGLERDKLRLEKARELGADLILISEEGDPVEEVRALTQGRGADVVVEAGGTPEAFNLAYQMVRGGGQIAALGYANQGELEPIILARQEITIHGLVAFTSKHFSKAISWLESGQVDNTAIVSHRLDLDRAEEGILLMKNKEATKVLLSV
jgi:L-iditol 2-dehydrogenase